jgi:hypothetical protein
MIPDLPWSRTLITSNGCNASVALTPPDTPATKCSYLTCWNRSRKLRPAPEVLLWCSVIQGLIVSRSSVCFFRHYLRSSTSHSAWFVYDAIAKLATLKLSLNKVCTKQGNCWLINIKCFCFHFSLKNSQQIHNFVKKGAVFFAAATNTRTFWESEKILFQDGRRFPRRR